MAEGNQNQGQLVLSVDGILENINKIYEEMRIEDHTVGEVDETKAEKIIKLKDLYLELINAGEFKDEETGRIKTRNEIARTILDEMEKRELNWSRQRVWDTLGDDYKRAWRRPIEGTFDTKTGKPMGVALLDSETKFIYDKYMKAVQLLKDFDYNELPKGAQIMLGEQFFDCYKHHNEEWLKHKITLVKGEQDTHDATKGDPIRIETGKKRRGELVVSMEELRDAINECIPIIESNPPEDLNMEHKYANAVRGLTAYFIPWKNRKWKKDWLNWINIHIREKELRSKSGAAKFSKIHVTSIEEGIDAWQGITREEIDKNRSRILRFARDFVRNFPYLGALSEYFMTVVEPPRALHTVKLHNTMSEAAFT